MDETVKAGTPLYVDLDGTFIRSDILYESLLSAIKRRPSIILRCFFWVLRGKAYLKHQLGKISNISIDSIPLNMEFHNFLRKEKARKRKIILATACNERYAEEFVRKYGIFDSHISSDAKTNLKGKKKLEIIQKQALHFAYAGNDKEDFEIFSHSNERYLVNPTYGAKRMIPTNAIDIVYDNHAPSLWDWIKQIRLYQWLKNLLIFVPLLVSGKYTMQENIILTVLGFLSFSSLASGTYIVNDLFDLEADRRHPRKKFRPLAAGLIQIKEAFVAVFMLLTFAFGLAFKVGGYFPFVLGLYLCITLLYSFSIKTFAGLDVITLASLYTIRILGGAAILRVPVSFWLLSFSMFIFFSLSLVKRCSELKSLEREGKIHAGGRDYNLQDYAVLMSLGTSSALLSILFFCFYTQSDVLQNQYQDPTLLWLIIPALGYWLSRIWIKTNRGEMHDDPIIFSLKDKGSISTIILMVIITIAAQTF